MHSRWQTKHVGPLTSITYRQRGRDRFGLAEGEGRGRVTGYIISPVLWLSTALIHWNVQNLQKNLFGISIKYSTFRISTPLEQVVLLCFINMCFYFTLQVWTGCPTLSYEDLLSKGFLCFMNSILHSTGVCVAVQSDFSGVKFRKHGNIFQLSTTWCFEKKKTVLVWKSETQEQL